MASTGTPIVALFSIRPKYAFAILSGSKKVEFRRGMLKQDIQYLVIYATSPIQKIIGIVNVATIREDSPRKLWSRYKHVGGIDKIDYESYFEGKEFGCAIEISSVRPLKNPLSLCDVSPKLSAPQSFRYLSPSHFETIQKRVA